MLPPWQGDESNLELKIKSCAVILVSELKRFQNITRELQNGSVCFFCFDSNFLYNNARPSHECLYSI